MDPIKTQLQLPRSGTRLRLPCVRKCKINKRCKNALHVVETYVFARQLKKNGPCMSLPHVILHLEAAPVYYLRRQQPLQVDRTYVHVMLYGVYMYVALRSPRTTAFYHWENGRQIRKNGHNG